MSVVPDRAIGAAFDRLEGLEKVSRGRDMAHCSH